MKHFVTIQSLRNLAGPYCARVSAHNSDTLNADDLLFKIEQAFEIPNRGRVIVPTIVDGHDFKIRPQDVIQLRTPEGHILDTHIVSVEFLKQEVGMCRMGILLPIDVADSDVPKGTDVWLRN